MGRGQELLDAAREGDRRTVEKIIGQITKRSGPFTSLRRGAGVNVQDDNGYTPLHHACLRGHKEIVQLLLSVEASPCIVDKKGATPFHLAAWKGDADILSMLLAHKNHPINVNQMTSDQETALHIAARSGYVVVVELLLAAGADVTLKNIKDETALDLAAQFGRLETVQHLLRVRPDLVNPYKYPICRGRGLPSTPLHLAAKNGHKDVVTALINAGVDPNIRTQNGTPLHEAASYGKASVVRVLLARGADLKAVDRRGKTVHELLDEYKGDATKRVKKEIRDYELNQSRNTYDSEDDCPPFPVQDSPSYPYPAGMYSDEVSGGGTHSLANNKDAFTKKSSLTVSINGSVFKARDSNNSFDAPQFRVPPSRSTTDSIVSNLSSITNSRLCEHSFSFVFNKKQELQPTQSDPQLTRLYNKSEALKLELSHSSQRRGSKTDSSSNPNIYTTSPHFYENISFEKNSNVRKPSHCKELESYNQIVLDLKNTLKKKPMPSPKPLKAVARKFSSEKKSLVFDFKKSMCKSEIDNKNEHQNADEKCEIDGVYENIQRGQINVPDDVKVKMCDMYGMGGYVAMDRHETNRRKSASDILSSDPKQIPATYATMHIVRKKTKSKESLHQYQPDIESCHTKGDAGCIYAPMDPMYIYAINPDCVTSNAPPFIRTKEKTDPPPCFCPKNAWGTSRTGEKELFYSCEDIYVNVTKPSDESDAEDCTNCVEDTIFKDIEDSVRNDDDDDIENYVIEKFDKVEVEDNTDSKTSNSVLRKKLRQLKQLFTDWKAPKTQKNTNTNDNPISPSPSSSSITKNHPQSFVKKLASKCLGLKSKFNSAPNISNNTGIESIEPKSKNPDHKSTNTLHIGNSKFFKMLSKKEESGEVVCNDEFDTISLDRLGTLNRDSVVNRSNRSCPGFKNSLPNISENTELSDSHASSVESVVITEINCDKNNENEAASKLNEAVNINAKITIFEPRERASMLSNLSGESANLVNECYESYEFSKEKKQCNETNTKVAPKPPPRPTLAISSNDDSKIYENVVVQNRTIKPTPAVRTYLPTKMPLDEVEKKVMYENVSLLRDKKAITIPMEEVQIVQTTDLDEDCSPCRSRTSSLSSDSLSDETNLEDILLSEKSKSFRHSKQYPLYPSLDVPEVYRAQSNASDLSEATEASAIENVDCSVDVSEKNLYLSMTGTLPNKKPERRVKKKVLFRHKTFTNIEADRNSTNVRDLPKWDNEFLKETLAHYHIRGTGHCMYQAPTVKEFIYIFNRDTLYKDVEPFVKVPNDKRDSYFETAICFCKPRPPKHHNSAEDLLELCPQEEEGTVSINFDALKDRIELNTTTFRCFCDSEDCKLHNNRREFASNLIVKFSMIKKSISTPDITLDSSPLPIARKNLSKIKSVSSLEEPYAVVKVDDIIAKNKFVENNKNLEDDTPSTPVYTAMSPHSTLSSTARPYSIKDITEVISLNSNCTSNDASLTRATGIPLRKSSSSEYSGHWSLQSCNSNVTIKSDASFKTCIEDSDDGSDGTLHSDEDSSDAETVKSEVSTGKRPWVHSDSFRFGTKDAKFDMDAIVEENSKQSDSKFESGISVEGSESSSSEGEGDSGIPRVDDVSLGAASLERGSGVGGVRSGSGRRRWDEAEGTSEGDALSVSSAASSCAPHLAHHHEYSKVSPTPPKKPPRRNLSVSPTHANSPSSGYSYELRPHARSQDDLDDIQGAKNYLKHGRSVDQYVDGKLSYSEYEENHNSPRIAPVPNPRPSIKNRPQPVAITAMYENVVIKEQNPRRKLRRNNFTTPYENCEPRMDIRRKYSAQERSSLESLLDDQSMNSPSDCDRYDGHRILVPQSPTHYDQPPTPDHPPPSAKQAENSIHEKIRPLSQEYKRRSALRDSYTETELCLLRAASAVSVASGATDRSGNTDNCVEEYVCDVPFAGLFKGSTTTLDGIGLRPMPAERPKTLRKLKSVYDASPTDQLAVNSNLTTNGQERSVNGVEDEVRRRSNTTSSTQSGDKSLSILSPFDEQEEWAKISEIMASFGSKLVRESVFVSELEQEFTSRLGLSCSESSLSPSVASTLGLWLAGIGLHDYEPLFMESGYDDIDFVNGILNENDLREMGIEESDRQKILDSVKQLPLKITEISNNYNNNNISKNQNESVDEWLRNINLEQYSETFRKHLYVDMDRVRRIWEVELTAVLEIQKPGHRKRILASVSGEHNGPMNHVEDISADLNTLKSNIKHLKEEIKEKLPISENLKPVPPPVVPHLAPPGGETLKRSKKNRPAPQPPRPSDLEIRAPSELLVGVPGALKTQWKHQPFVLVTGAVTYVANYLGSTVVKELRGTESTKKSIQKLKKNTKEPRDSPDIILSISYRGVKFLNTITRELICEHEIRNIHCACQDADDLTHFAYITKDHATRSHYCHVFRVATMDQATEVILTLGEAFEVAYQMALREQANRARVTQSLAKTPTHDPMTTSIKEKPNMNHGRSHSITEIKLNGHQLKIAPIPASLSNEDFQASKNSDGSRSPRTPLLKAPIASTEEL